MLHALIMAGGSGTRFWPVSREARPKQLLNLLGKRSLLQDTLERLGDLVPRARIMVATAAALAPAVREQLPDLPEQSILAEPCRRDTAPCIGLAALLMLRDDPDASMLVLPADHVIRDAAAFQNAIRQALAMTDRAPQRLITFGIPPSYPAESFGYLERGAPLPAATSVPGVEGAKGAALTAYRVARFREKPKADVARQYLAAGNFLWNAGIFVWRAQAILQALRAREPEMCAHLERIAAAAGTPEFADTFAREFAAIRGISIDFAVMEHAEDVAMIEAPFDWDDLGSWQALARQRGCDAAGNTIVGRHLGMNTQGTIVYSAAGAEHLIVTVGLEDLIVVHTPDATLVARRGDEESLRNVVKKISEQGWPEHL